MLEKIIKKEKINFYISIDGKEFDNAEDCIRHEKSLELKKIYLLEIITFEGNKRLDSFKYLKKIEDCLSFLKRKKIDVNSSVEDIENLIEEDNEFNFFDDVSATIFIKKIIIDEKLL